MDRNDLRRDWGPSALNAASRPASRHGTNCRSATATWERYQRRGKQIGQRLAIQRDRDAAERISFYAAVGSNRSGDGDTRNPDRPSINPAFTGPCDPGKPNQWFNPARLRCRPGHLRELGRGRSPGRDWPTWTFRFQEHRRSRKKPACNSGRSFSTCSTTQLRAAECDGLFGHAVSPSAGLITTTATNPRQIQFGLKLIF